jgi:hypothetical protein
VNRKPGPPILVARRPLLLGATAAGAALALGACGKDSVSPYAGGLRLIALAAAMENQAVWLYRTALANAGGSGGALPAVFEQFAHAAADHHVQHAAAWNAILRAAGKPAVLGTPLSTQSSVAAALGSARTLAGVAALAARLEDRAARTFAAAAAAPPSTATAGTATPSAANRSAAAPGRTNQATTGATAASIAPVEAMHAAVLRFLAGSYPTPDDLLGSGGATVAELTA